jgi:hypothetical protein
MRRIVLSLTLTVIGLILSWVFLRPHEWQTDSVNSRQSIAQVVSLSNDVSRQEEGRLLWSPIRKGDKIYAGDKIKTSGLSATTIQFADSKAKLDIEENSIVLVSLDHNKFSLNMLEGRVFVKGEDSGSSLNLLSAGKKIDYAGDTAISLTQSGESKVESFNEESLFHDLKPAYSQALLTARANVDLEWKPEARQTTVDIFVGESPALMKKVISGISFTEGKVSVPMKPGVNYWQLGITEEGKETKSPLMKVVLNRPLPPTQIFPLNKEVVKGNDRAFDFKWNKGSSAGVTVIEVSTESDFKAPVIKEEVRDQTFFTPAKVLTEGEYYWRLSFLLPSGEKVESPVTIFTVHAGGGLLSPAPLIPSEKARFYLRADASAEIKFEWKRQENVTYTLKLSGANFNKELESDLNNASVILTQTGIYKWEVFSKTPDGKLSILPSLRTFEVKNQSKIPWLTEQKIYTYLENFPVIILRWQKNYPGTAVLRIARSPDFKDAEVSNVPGKDFPFRPANDGTYFARIQGMDENGMIAAISDVFDFEVKAAPLPPAPLSMAKGNKLMASSQGEFSLKITNQKMNWLLIAQLVDQKGGVLDERRFSDGTVKFSGLLPGQYVLRTNFQDEYNRKGDVTVLELLVPEKSMIPAPKVKGIKVR